MTSKDITAANPQGKASISILNDIDASKPFQVKEKNTPQWLADYFTSLLVLSSKFSFKPVINKDYYLYIDSSECKLSLIEPRAWHNCPYTYFGKCRLHEDRTWSLEAKDNWQNNTQLKESINNMRKDFLYSLNTDTPIISTLPYYSSQLPYYQRIAANGLAKSLQQSLQLKLGLEASKTASGKIMIDKIKDTDTMLLGILNQD